MANPNFHMILRRLLIVLPMNYVVGKGNIPWYLSRLIVLIAVGSALYGLPGLMASLEVRRMFCFVFVMFCSAVCNVHSFPVACLRCLTHSNKFYRIEKKPTRYAPSATILSTTPLPQRAPRAPQANHHHQATLLRTSSSCWPKSPWPSAPVACTNAEWLT